jgi:hypothetical protein
MQHALAALILFLALPAGSVDAVREDFAYLSRQDETLQTHHDLRFAFTMDADWHLAEPLHRTARFDDVPYEVSLSAFVQADAAIMVHAERVSDGSGASDYTHLPVSSWPTLGYRGQPRACIEVGAEEVAGEHDLAWLRDRGFDVTGTVWLEQYFLSSDDFNDEIVVSLIVRGTDCDAGDDADAELARLRSDLQVVPLTD